ncbi:unnamed protein product [Didymodactylos carnosus]|uniref:Uncharacterized protein n=1 Tax=Didymodactylos carnosus TaxID=1234261 RepID=A0A813Q908_9BILA|nr:unnamed protein product [Didymodactylos carnosus]CAF3544826.1 unnamed protein product [Didymodactylos carnosus]
MSSQIELDTAVESVLDTSTSSQKSLNRSSSNPDLSQNKTISSSISLLNDDVDNSAFVVKVYRSDQSFKYFPVHKDTTAKQLVMLAITEFGIADPSRCYSLCEVSAENGVIKQKRLSDQIDNLPERLPLNARYYLKNNHSTETLVPDQMAHELIREAQINFLQLDALEICAQLTLKDFSLFKNIQPTEYIDHVFKLNSLYGSPNLDKFLKLPNQEMYWTITEIVRETNIVRRSKVIKHFIKIAKCCKEMKNFNSMFAVISGLDHKAVQRLQTTWERIPDKYKKFFEELKSLLDLSRNMSVYRNLLKSELIVPPIIPMFPVCMKDLTFIHLGNQSEDDGLINFEKLRMLAKEIRHIIGMSSSSYDISNMFDSPTPHSHVFAGFGNSTDAFSTIKRTHTGMRLSVVANAKRLYDEASMVKKVKAYLSTAEVIQDESRLVDLANQCEPVCSSPSSGTIAASSIQEENEKFVFITTPVDDNKHKNNRRAPSPSSPLGLVNAIIQNVSTLKRRGPSPSTSSLSSNSSCDRRPGQQTKFDSYAGTQSPDAVNKLLQLSDSNRVKPRAPQRPFYHHPVSPLPLTSSISTTNPTSVNLATTSTTPLLSMPTSSPPLLTLNKRQVSNVKIALTSESSSLNPSHRLKHHHHRYHHHYSNSNSKSSVDQPLSGSPVSHDGDSGRGSLNSTNECIADNNITINGLTGGSHSSSNSTTSESTVLDSYSTKYSTSKHRPPLPVSMSVATVSQSQKMRNWMKRSQSQNEVDSDTNRINSVTDEQNNPLELDYEEQVTAV